MKPLINDTYVILDAPNSENVIPNRVLEHAHIWMKFEHRKPKSHPVSVTITPNPKTMTDNA
jgi:hypothetical protein